MHFRNQGPKIRESWTRRNYLVQSLDVELHSNSNHMMTCVLHFFLFQQHDPAQPNYKK